MNPFGHIDLRVPSFAEYLPFYEKLLPALGFTRTFHSTEWRVFAADGELPQARYPVVPGHENPEIERVVERGEQYLIVDKLPDAERYVGADGKPDSGS